MSAKDTNVGKDTEQRLARLCVICGEPRGKGRVRYCSDACNSVGRARQTRVRDDGRIGACWRCKGPKEPGTRGGKYCAECRRIMADASTQADAERSRRRHLAATVERLEAGELVSRRRVDTPDGQKWCARCQAFRPLTSFPARKNRAVGPYCKPCQRSYNQERRLLLDFGLTWEEYDALSAAQDHRCAICCGKPRRHALAVDHDHRTGEIRGLLCARCNQRLLGAANDDPARLRKAADYLEAFHPRAVFGAARVVPSSARPDILTSATRKDESA